MEQTQSYNIHDILKFQIVRDKTYGFLDRINLKFAYFRVDGVDKPDIVLNIGRFSPANKGCYLVDHKYYVRDNYFYCRDSEGGAGWEVEVDGIEEGDTVINFTARHFPGLEAVINPDLIAQIFLLKLIIYRLSRKGYFVIHSAAVSENNHAYLLCGRGSSFKTSLCMDFVRRAGLSCLGDDRVILHRDEVLGFLMQPSLFRFMTDHLADETAFGLREKARYLWRLLRCDGAADVQATRSARLKALLFISRSNRQPVGELPAVSPVPAEDLASVISRMRENNRLEDFTYQIPAFGIYSAPFARYMMAYSFVFPHSRIAACEAEFEEGLRRILGEIPGYQVAIPLDYSPGVFSRVRRLVSELV